MPTMKELEANIVAVLRQCIDNGMKLPFIVCVISPNGSVLVTRANKGREPDVLAHHIENDVFTSPVNIMVVDHHGEAVRIVIERGEISYH
jgi:hypothetical protein